MLQFNLQHILSQIENKKTYTILTIIFLFQGLLPIHAQVEDITWQKCLGTDETDYAYAAAKFRDGYLFGILIGTDGPGITNFHYNPDHQNGDAWIVFTDSLGEIIWERCYGGTENESPRKIIPVNENEIYLLNESRSTDGDVKSTNYGYRDIWVVKIDNTGNIIWERCYGAPNSDEAKDAVLTPDGGLLLLGRINAAGGNVSQHFGNWDAWVCKIDSSGEIQWEKTIGNQGHDNALKLRLTSDTTFIVIAGLNASGGMAECEHMGPWDGLDIWLIEMDLQGNILRQLCYGGSGNDLGRDIIKIEDGFVFVAKTDSNDGDVSGLHGADDIWVVRIDNSGTIIWQNCLGGTSYEWADYITQNEDGGFTVIGHTKSNNGDVSNNNSLNTTRYDIWVIKLSSEGILEWEHCFGGIASEQFWGRHAVIKESDQHYILATVSEAESIDVECDLYGFPDKDAWIFEIKDCSLFMPQTPSQAYGPDTLCTTTDSISTYIINPAAGAWSYEWNLSPPEAGTLNSDSTLALLHWASNWEGQAEIKVRSRNDCGNSEWSEVHNSWAYSCLGVGDIQQAKPAFVLFPNPAQSEIHCRLSIVGCRLSMYIYDLFGRKQHEIQIPKGQKQVKIDVSGFSPGIYLAVLRNEKEVLGRKKFVVR